jgi:DNA-directed RNA polymerase subunit RPC12/RpoP
MPSRAPRSNPAELRRRVAALEARVAQLESGKAGPGDGRAAAPEPKPRAHRCPGCGLALRTRLGRCAACGRPVDRAQAAPARSRRR